MSTANSCALLLFIDQDPASDDEAWQPHIRNKRRRDAIATRFKNADDPLQIVLVRDMWLTGFDVPPLHTMYLDKPMRGHGLMQTIARVNRVFRDKPGGLVVDYLGLANNLKEALRTYAESGGAGEAVRDVETPKRELVAVMLEKLELCRSLFYGFDYTDFLTGSAAERAALIPRAQEFVLLHEIRDNGFLKRFTDAATGLLRAFAFAGATEEARQVRKEVAFFQTVKSAVVKTTSRGAGPDQSLDHAVRQLVDEAVTPQGVVDIFAAAGLDKPNISILSEGFLAEVRDLPHRNLAVELLDKLLRDEVSAHGRSQLVQSRAFSERLITSMTRYHNRAIETAQVIEELIDLARDMRGARDRGEQLGLSVEELAFYDALGVNDSAVKVLGDDILRAIARDLAETVRQNTTIDWTIRETVRANLRRHVRRTLRKHKYPPDQQEAATKTIIDQAELLSRDHAA